MTMEHPVAGVAGNELHIAGLRDTHKDCVSWSPCGFGLAASFSACNDELVPMKVDRMVVHSQINTADADALPVPHNQGSGGWARFSVEREPIELHVHGVWDGDIREYGILLHDDHEILIDASLVGFLRMHDECADHPHHFLHCHV